MTARRVLAMTTLVLAPALLPAQELPAAKTLIDAWATAVKADAWKGHKTARQTAAFDIPAMGMSAKMEAVQRMVPPMQISKVEIPGMGEMRQGFDGKNAWSVNPMAGAQIMPGDASAQQAEDSDPDNYSRRSSAIVKSETVEKTKLNDQDCYKVKHTWKSGRETFDCFAVNGGLIVWSQAKSKTPMGEVEIVTTFSAYKDFGGIMRATTTTVDQGGQQFVITLQGWEWDTVKDEEFELPAEVKAIIPK